MSPKDDVESGTGPRGAEELQDRAPSWFWDVFAYAPAFALVPLGVAGVAGLLGRGPRVLRDNKVASALLSAGTLVGLSYWQMQRWFTEQPAYRVERADKGFEVRLYEPRVVAETTVEHDSWEKSLNEGFRRLAGYIYGANEGKQRMTMTAPVNVTSEARGFVVTFTLPKKRALGSLPAPRDPRVRLREEKSQRVAALRYRGTYQGRGVEAMQAELLQRLRAVGERPSGEPFFAGYDSPSTLPFLRRIEIWVPLS